MKLCPNCKWQGEDKDLIPSTIGPYYNCPKCGDSVIDVVVDTPKVETVKEVKKAEPEKIVPILRNKKR